MQFARLPHEPLFQVTVLTASSRSVCPREKWWFWLNAKKGSAKWPRERRAISCTYS